MRFAHRWLVCAPLLLLVAACGGVASTGGASGGASPGAATPAGGPVRLQTDQARIGGRSTTVLTDGRGFTLYYFELDAKGAVACQGACAKEWKPVVTTGAAPSAGTGVTGHVGSMASSQEGTVVTYNGWPLYTYVGDPQAGTANGEGVDDFGGKWFAARPDLRSNTPSTSPTPTAGYGY